ncbi:MAG: DNA-primase RepB domain-containing protein [Candidatus Peregrinibacteria bacterium]
MDNILHAHREETEQITSEKLLCYFPQSFTQYLDDSPKKDQRKALSAERFDPEQAKRKQAEGCGVYFTPNAFEGGRRIANLVHIQAVYLDLDCAKEGDATPGEAMERKKTDALLTLITAKLQPHLIVETKNGLQAVWRVIPVGGEKGLRMFRETMDILLRRFGGDPGAKDPTRVLRLPGFLHLKNPKEPFPCLILHQNLDQEPYDLQTIIDEFYLPPEEPQTATEPAAQPQSPYDRLNIEEVIRDAAKEAGIEATLRKNSDGSRQIVENGEATSGFISARGNFCYSSSGKERKGGPVQVVQYYLKLEREEAETWLDRRYAQESAEDDALAAARYRELHPAQSFIGGKAFTTVVLPKMVEGHVKRLPVILTSQRERFPIMDEALMERGFFTERSPSPDVRWDPADVHAFLQGIPLSVTLRGVQADIEKLSRAYIDFEDDRLHPLLSLWVIGTYFHRLFRTYPYIHLRGNAGTGKSKTLQLMQLLCFNAEMFTSNSSSPYVIRVVHDNAATCCIDEVERLTRGCDDDAKAVISMYNAGYKRGSFIGKCEPEGKQSKWKRKRFEAYSPKAFAGIRGLDGSLASRCIPITMLHSGNRSITNRELDDEMPEWQQLRNALYRCMMTMHVPLREKYERLSDDVLLGREFELWRPLLSVAQLCDGSGYLYGNMRQLAVEMQERKREDQREDIATPKLLEGLLKFLEEKMTDEFECSYSDLIEFLPNFDEQFEWLGDGTVKKVRKSRWIGDELRASGVLSSAAKKVRKAGRQERMIVLQKDRIKERLSTYEQ